MSDAAPTKAWLLTALFTDRWVETWNPYRLNQLMNLPPWWPALPTVWTTPEPPAWEAGERLVYWNEARRLLEDLHDDYRAHRGPPA
jgi:hypothetical protein